jgi:hypothetical protein
MLWDFKKYFYVNSHTDKRVGYFITMGVIVRRDDESGIAVKGNNDSEWSSSSMVL